MKRILLIALRKLIYIPYKWLKLCHYARHIHKYNEKSHYAMIKDIADLIISGGNIDIKVYGEENIPAENGFMLFPNHQGLFDGFAIVHACPAPFSVVYKTELKDIPFLKQLFACVQALPLERDNPKQGVLVIQRVSEEVKSGRNFMIFAEGTRSKNKNTLLDFKGGSFKSALKSRCPILPIALIDSYKVFDTKSAKPVTVQVHILKPITYDEYHHMKTTELASMVKEKIEKTIKTYS